MATLSVLESVALARGFDDVTATCQPVERSARKTLAAEHLGPIVEGYGTKIRVWDVASGDQIATTKRTTGAIFGVAFSPDGKRIATASTDKIVNLLDARNGQEIISLYTGDAGCSAATSSPDGTRLAAAVGRSGIVRIWDAPREHETTFLGGHTDTVTNVTFSHDGSRIYSESENERKVWDVAILGRGERSSGWPRLERGTSETPRLPSQARSSPGHPLILKGAKWEPPAEPRHTSPDGRWLVTTESNNVVLVDLQYRHSPDEKARRTANATAYCGDQEGRH